MKDKLKIGQYINKKLDEVEEQLEAFGESFEELIEEDEEMAEEMTYEEFDGMFAQFLAPEVEEGAEGIEVQEATVETTAQPVIDAPTAPALVPAPVVVAPPAPVEAPKLNVDLAEQARLEAALAGNKTEAPVVELTEAEKKKLKAEAKDKREREFIAKKKKEREASEAKTAEAKS